MQLSPDMREILGILRACDEPLLEEQIQHSRKLSWRSPVRTLRALERRGLCKQGRLSNRPDPWGLGYQFFWEVTAAGKQENTQ